MSRRDWPDAREHPASDAAGLDVASTPCSVGIARRYCVAECARLGWAGYTDDVEVLVSELVTNAVVHAGGSRVRVRVLEQGLRLRVEVSDQGLNPPVPRGADADAEDGRGLTMVGALAVAAGCDVCLTGKTTWFEVGI